jgi:hypothetical protein
MSDYKVGDRVESVAGDFCGERGFVTELHPEEDCSVWWRTDSGSEIRCIPQRIRHAPPNPIGWVPRCGDRVRILVKDQRSRSAFVVNTENPQNIFVALLWAKGAVAGGYKPSELELTSAALHGEHAGQRCPDREADGVNGAQCVLPKHHLGPHTLNHPDTP